MSYAYDLAGHVTSINYPSTHTVNYNYDGAGRLADNGSNLAFTGNLGAGGDPRNYSTAIIYDSAGRMTKEQLGKPKNQNRGQASVLCDSVADIIKPITGAATIENRTDRRPDPVLAPAQQSGFAN
jgi:YD repeat-containing protein